MRERVIIIFLFILGIIFIAFIYPIGDSLSGLIITFLEMVKGKLAVKLAEYNTQIEKLQNQEQQNTQAIGFTIPENKEEDEDNDL